MEYKRQRILIVEDESIIALATAADLRAHDYEVEVSRSGEQALAYIHANRSIDVVVMDVDLGPGISGLECAEQIQATWGIPVVFRTANTRPATVRRARQIDHLGFVDKSKPGFHVRRAVDYASTRISPAPCAAQGCVELVERADPEMAIVFELDLAGKLQYVSKAIARQIGVSPGTILGQHYSAYVVPEDLLSADQLFFAVIGGAEVTRHRLLKRGLGGVRFRVEITGRPIYEAETVVGFCGVERVLQDAA